ncbi:MAG: TIGR03617 family F420-dependent LLM class oxidoreductase [Pseudomonadota bacterium]
MKIFNTLPQADLGAVAERTHQIAAAGYTGIVTLENRHDPFLPLAVAASTGEKLELTTGVAIAFLRSPMSAAHLAWDLNQACGGRFTLGLGPQIRAHNEKRFSVPWSAPAPRLREYANALRAIWRCWKFGDKLSFEGEHYRFSLMTPNFVPEDDDRPLPAIALAAVGPRMLNLSGEVADAVYLHPFCTPLYIEQAVLPGVDAGLAKSGRLRENFAIIGGGYIATGRDQQALDEMIEWVRMRIGFYGSTPAYWPVFEAHDLGDLGRELNALTKAGKWDKLSGLIPDEMVHQVAAVGLHHEIKDKVIERFGGYADGVFASVSYEMPDNMPRELVSEIAALPTRWLAYETGTA